jgi:ABC-type uncharacterized transport system auxiliary subunit
MNRRALIVAPLLLGACSVLPDRPFVPARRYMLDPQRPARNPPQPGAPVLLVRRLRAVPGLQDVALRRRRPDGAYEVAAFEEWIAPPADLAEAALRAWMQATGRFSAVVAPGSRADADLVLEAQLTVLEAGPGEARAGIAGVLLREVGLGTRVLVAFEMTETAPLPQPAQPPQEAAAMAAALGACFGRLEAVLSPHLRG